MLSCYTKLDFKNDFVIIINVEHIESIYLSYLEILLFKIGSPWNDLGTAVDSMTLNSSCLTLEILMMLLSSLVSPNWL